ncbi:MAG: hypothetical protein J7623_21925 [Chitinophaga sp.]|uniref:hypothetical protein n=1 Tax=Chitinophaga sp. TaxID=1869181 RepID=UPI001B12EDDD|nr:hypothetical protein [Chitinophaga sp.]MBO9731313.1 hypothetical protein [Chitinophaga sp.]
MRIMMIMMAISIATAACHGAPAKQLPSDSLPLSHGQMQPPDTVAPALLKNKSLEEAIAIAGPPDEATEFYMSGTLSAFRKGLLNFFSPKNYSHQRIQIKEVTWYNGAQNITTWYREEHLSWRFITMSVWDKDAVFSGSGQ